METDVVIALSAVIIALAALFVSLWQAFQTVRHNKLSVKPHLRFDTVTAPGQPISLVIRNTGVGPAVIREFYIHVDGAVLKGDPFEILAQGKNQIGLAAYEWTCAIPVPGDALSAGEQMELLAFPNSSEESAERKKILREISRLRIRIAYESMYGGGFDLEGTPQGPRGEHKA